MQPSMKPSSSAHGPPSLVRCDKLCDGFVSAWTPPENQALEQGLTGPVETGV